MTKVEPIQKSHLQVDTNLEVLPYVLDWFSDFAKKSLPHDLLWECQVALTEGFTNVIRHAHGHLAPQTAIDLEIRLFYDYLEICIWDFGNPFDWEAKLAEIQGEELDPLEKEGGRGLLFMHQLTDELSYNRCDDNRNCLTMRKKLTNTFGSP